MPINQRNAGFISTTYQPLKVANAPTIGAATAGVGAASVAFTAPANVGGSAISAYYAVSNPDRVTVSGASSPINVTGLTNGTAYTFSVWALNTYGPSPFSGASGSVTPAAPNALIFGGTAAGSVNIVSITIATGGTPSSFGTMTAGRSYSGALASSTRAVVAGGVGIGVGRISSIEYISFSSGGSTSSFGNLNVARESSYGFSNSTIGCFAGGSTGAGPTSSIQFITIASTGNSESFGNLDSGATNQPAASGSTTRGVIAGGNNSEGVKLNNISFITYASQSNSTDFGDLAAASNGLASGSSSTRAVFGGGLTESYSNVISYVTIASEGNATDFGDLTTNHRFSAGLSDSISLIFGGGEGSSGAASKITIATTGNSVSAGSGYPNTAPSGCSSAHGGLS